MSEKTAEYYTNNNDISDDELTRREDKSEFIHLAMKLLELKNITDTSEIKIHLQIVKLSLLKRPYDQKPNDN